MKISCPPFLLWYPKGEALWLDFAGFTDGGQKVTDFLNRPRRVLNGSHMSDAFKNDVFDVRYLPGHDFAGFDKHDIIFIVQAIRRVENSEIPK